MKSTETMAPQSGPDEMARALVQNNRVHRDIYTAQDVFAAEQQHLFRRAWLLAGHASEVPQAGDYLTVTLADTPILIIRQTDGSLRAMHNRCAHKGSAIFSERLGNTPAIMRCPYHGWTYRTDGSLQNIPLRPQYEATGFDQCNAAGGLVAQPALKEYRGFIFVRLSATGMQFDAYFGEALRAIDNMVDRSPAGELRLIQPPLRQHIACNWKIYLENINDAMHPVSAHHSAWATAREFWSNKPDELSKPMAIEQMLPFGAGYDFFDRMGARILPNGHSFFGTRANIHSSYSDVDDYVSAMDQAYGRQRRDEILSFQSQNTVLYPTLSVKPSPLSMRVLRPVSAGETILEVWAFEAIGAPERLLERSLTYNRVAFSPMSVVAHDDIHLFETIQTTLNSDANPWISLHRGALDATMKHEGNVAVDVKSSDEALMRNQFQAWAQLMRGE